MRPETAEWIEKAEGDFRTAGREKNSAEYPNYDAACFHAQQCAEKYLKARLVEAGKDFPKTHDLSAILNLVLSFEPSRESLKEEWETGIRYLNMEGENEDPASEQNKIYRKNVG